MIWFSVAAISILMAAFTFLCIRYRNPYQLIMVIGKKGSGKTTLLTKLALKHKKQGWNVYSNFPVPGCHLFQIEDLGYKNIPEESVILIDEVGMIFDNRNFKNFKPELRDYFKLQRHHRHKIYLFSQSFDIDKKLRDLCDRLYIVDCRFNVFSYAKRVVKNIVVTNHQDNNCAASGESQITEDFIIEPFIFFMFGSRQFTFIPAYAKYFNSYDLVLYDRDVVAEYVEEPEWVHWSKRKRLVNNTKKAASMTKTLVSSAMQAKKEKIKKSFHK